MFFSYDTFVTSAFCRHKIEFFNLSLRKMCPAHGLFGTPDFKMTLFHEKMSTSKNMFYDLSTGHR